MLLALLLMLYATLHLRVVQNFLITRVTTVLSEKLNTTIKIDHIDFSFFDKLDLKGLLVKDLHKDTLIAAGSATIKINDWFFVKNQVVLHYVTLKDATVNLNRTDSVWNYQFLIDFFKNPTPSGKKNSLALDIKEVHFKNIRFNQVDKWKGQDMLGSIKDLALFADTFDLKKKKIRINTLTMEEPAFTMSDYTGNRDRLGQTFVKPTVKKESNSTLQWNPDQWSVSVKEIQMLNGIFRNERESDRERYNKGRFDEEHISFEGITGNLRNVLFEKDTVIADANLATKERSGFEVKKLAALLKFTPELMEFNRLDLQTNNSKLGNYYSMRYTDFNEDMKSFLHKVKLEGNFENSELSSDDLAYFAPELSSWKRLIKISGKAKGTIDNLTAKKMLLQSGNTIIDGEISMNGLPTIDSTFIEFNSRYLQTSYADLSSFIPQLKGITQPNLNNLGNIRFKGNFTGFINDFVAFGTINSNLGAVVADINLKLPENKPPVYSGNISTDGFKLGDFIETSQIGTIAFNGKIKGSGFSIDDVNTYFDGNVKSLFAGGYNYQNIFVKGDFVKKLFKGKANINDPNLIIDSLNGSIDFNGIEPAFNFDAQLSKADFRKLQLTREDFTLKGHFNLNFTGKNIDNFLGTAKVNNASLLHNEIPLSFDSLILESQRIGDEKYLSLLSNEIDATIAGKFKIVELPDAFKVFLSKYFPAYIKKPTYLLNDQDFSFNIKTKNVDEYVALLFDKKLRGFNYSKLAGNLKLKSNELNLTDTIPQFIYDGKVFDNVRLNSYGNADTLITRLNIDNIAINDSIHLPATDIFIASSNDVSNISINTNASIASSKASINARLKTNKDGFDIHFFPSSININQQNWQLVKDGEISLKNGEINASEIKFIQGSQEINISTIPSEQGDKNDVVIELSKVHIEDFVPLFLSEPRLEGQLSGNVRISNPFGKAFFEYDTKVDGFRSDNDSIGLIKSSGSYNTQTGLLLFKADADNELNQFNVDGSLNVKDSTGSQTRIAIRAEKFDLSMLNTYLYDLFSDIKGTANTKDLQLIGKDGHLTFVGTVNINDGSLMVNFTQCKYKFKNESIVFNPDEINFGNIQLKDTLNNIATVSGKMYHQFFKNIEFDNILFETEKLLVLNTTKKDNSSFFGKVIGKATMKLNGTADDIVMNIKGEPSNGAGSQIYILSGNSVESGVIDYIDFVQFGSKMEDDFSKKLSSRILVNMELVANTSCKIDVVLDEATGDVIKGTGNGLLKIRVGNKEPLTINGRYDISKGEYTFNFQTFLSKYFAVNSGSIVWDGDPFKAKIDIIADYTAEKVDFSSLSGSSNGFRQRGDLKIVSHLTETLLKPAIDFEFKLPTGSSLSNNFEIVKRLEQFQQDKNDLNKQVTSILLFNSFINNNQNFISTGSGYNVIASTIGGVMSNAISGYFNKFLQRYIKNLSINVDLNTSLGPDLQNNVQRLQAAAKSNFVYSVLNGRLIITAGVNVDYNNPFTNLNRNNVLVTPDIMAEWILSKDGRVRVVGFNRTNFDFIGQRNRTGVSLSYRKDIDKLSQLFSKY